MDELELLKKDWKEQGDKYPKLSYNELYKMILKKSSSIVKWIFIISIIELLFWPVLDGLFKLFGFRPQVEIPFYTEIIIGLNTIFYPVILYFIYKFYKNYKMISVTDSAKELIENILKTRRTTKQYVWFNISFFFLASCFLYVMMFLYDPQFSKFVNGETSTLKLVVMVLSILFFITLFVAVIWGVYQLIYGTLLRRLNKNYKELKQMNL